MPEPRRLLDKAVMEAEYLFCFPLPPDELRVNRRQGQHWGTSQGIKSPYRLECWNIIGEWPHVPLLACRIDVVAYLGPRQRCDLSDLGSWAKVPLDMLVSRGVIATDSSGCVKLFTARVERDRVNPRLEIHVREVEA